MYVYTYRMQEYIIYMLCSVVHCASVLSCSCLSMRRMGGVCSVVHCASVLSCSCLSMRRMGGDMHLLIDGQKSGVVLDYIDS